jgi:hypothetical protein
MKHDFNILKVWFEEFQMKIKDFVPPILINIYRKMLGGGKR